jgi:hypothetical protein
MWSLGSCILSKFLKRRTFFVSQSNPEKILEHVSKYQLEQKFGGDAPNHLGEYWPPKIPNTRIDPQRKNVYIKKKDYYWNFVKGDADSMNLNENILNGFQVE